MIAALAFMTVDQGVEGVHSLILDTDKLRDKALAKAILIASEERRKLPYQCPDSTDVGPYVVVYGAIFTEEDRSFDSWREAEVSPPAAIHAALTLQYDNPNNLTPYEYERAANGRQNR